MSYAIFAGTHFLWGFRVVTGPVFHADQRVMRAFSNFGLWRPGGAFFQIGLGCVMSHHQAPQRRALHIPVLILAGKFKMAFLPTARLTKAYPVILN